MQLKFLQEHRGAFYLVFRILVGLLFFLHGLGKLQSGASGIFLLAGIIEFAVGLAVLIGWKVELASALGGAQMIVAYFWMHASKGWNPLGNGGEAALLFLAAFLVLATMGACPHGKKKKK